MAKRSITFTESELRSLVSECVRQMVNEDVIGYDWKRDKDGKYINPNSKGQGKDRATKGHKVGDSVSVNSGKNKQGEVQYRNYTKIRDAVPHTEGEANGAAVLRGYKQFRYNPNTPGVVYPLYVNTEFDANHKQGLKQGVVYNAGNGELWVQKENGRQYTASELDFLAARSGWHLIDTPWGNQRGGTKEKGMTYDDGVGRFAHTNDDEVWALCEIYGECVDDEAKKQGNTPKDQYMQEVPKGKWYHYKTNSNASDDVSWIIADKIKIVKILTDDEVDSTNDEYFRDKPRTYKDNKGREKLTYYPMPRKNGNRLSQNDLERMGF